MSVIGILAAAFLGLLVGSFLNVVVYRVPRGESVVRPGSACPHCGQPIAARDNVPVLSWLLLRGRGRCCRSPIAVRYPLVEAGTALAFAAVAGWRGLSWTLPAWWYLAAVSIALALIDVDVHRLPDVLTLPSYLVGPLLLAGGLALDGVTGPGGLAWGEVGHTMLRAVEAGAAVWVWYWITYRAARLAYGAGAFGFGDVKLSGVLGLYLGSLGWGPVLVGVFLGYLTGGLVGIALLAAGRAGRRTQVPFGPYMIVGAWAAAMWGSAIADWYLSIAGL